MHPWPCWVSWCGWVADCCSASLAVFLLDLTGLERAIVILVSAMPSAVNSVVFATETHLDEDLVASIVALSICIGIAVLPWLPRLSLFLLG